MSNRLSKESSPYLLQHADNPVDWYPWSDETLHIAGVQNKPILLSIGYSACHWCHVMAHESFANSTIADVMNQRFVNIKVDREERPDIDRIYQLAHQLLTQRPGGWPLNMFLHPQTHRPFFGGTYFPPVAKHGLPAFADLLEHVAQYFAENSEEIRSQGEQIMDIFAELEPPTTQAAAIKSTPLQTFPEKVSQSFDRDYGGMGNAQKFPQTPILNGLLRRWRSTANTAEPKLDALYMVSLTLTRMAHGGIVDHLGGGFFRYSVDRYWDVPHFEKMLYDNGPLLALYAQAYLATGDPLFAKTAHATANWVLRDMVAGNGGFYSSIDADSTAGEGKFYVWTREEICQLLGDEQYALFAAHYGLDGDANFDDAWNLRVVKDLESIATETNQPIHELQQALDTAQDLLFKKRARREAPSRDEKQLLSWNALMIRGAAIAGRALERDDLLTTAFAAAEFVRTRLMHQGRLHASFKDGKATIDAYLDDYAFMIDALLELLQARWSSELLGFAITLADDLLARFQDEENGGFFFTSTAHEQLIVRSKPLADESMPSGNGIASLALQRLGYLTGNTAYLDAAERTLEAAYAAMHDVPHGHASLLDALEEYLSPPELIIIRGATDEIQNWQMSAAKLYAPARLVFAIPADATDLPAALAEKPVGDEETLAYRCVGRQCDLPVTSFEALAAAIRERPGTA